MGATGSQFRQRTVALAKIIVRGLYAVIDGPSAANQPKDQCQFLVVTGGDGVVDIPAVAGTYPLLAAADVPYGIGLDISSLALYVNGTVAWSGGTGTTVSISLQGTDGTVLATFTQNALTGSASDASPTTYSISPGSTLATGVLDPGGIRTIKANLARGVGLQAVVTNSTAGSPVRLRIVGHCVAV